MSLITHGTTRWLSRLVLAGLPLCLPGCAPFGAAPPDAEAADASAELDTSRKLPAVWRLFDDPTVQRLEYWRAKPLASILVAHSLTPVATDADRAAVARLKAGEFSPRNIYAGLDLGVPPRWDENPLGSSTWDFYRHALLWAAPLVSVWYTDGDAESLALLQDIIRDWRRHNGEPPGVSEYAWYDHAVSHRLRLFCWIWELYRTSDAPTETFAQDLLRLIHAHAEAIADEDMYVPSSNHGLEQNLALLGAAVTVSEFRDAPRWFDLVSRRMTAYVAENFSPEGFHREQSPGYHWFVLVRLGRMIEYLRVNDRPLFSGLDETARRAAVVWPYLIRPNNQVANIGDTSTSPAPAYMPSWGRWWGNDTPITAASSMLNPRSDAGEFLLDFDVGYAVFTGYSISGPQPTCDTYALFKCNAFAYAHAHPDALSFILYGRGRDWLVDAGMFSYEDQAPQRQFVRSARAHNLVLVDEQDFRFGEVELVDFGRTERGDFVTVRHHLPQATHTRTITFIWPETIEIHDVLSATDNEPHTYTQLFHAAPDLLVMVDSDRVARLTAADGTTCVIEQIGSAGDWQVITGQTEPYWQGWYSPAFNEIEPAPALHYSNRAPLETFEFQTTIRLLDSGS